MNVNFKLRDLLEAGMHLGHKTNKWNPNMNQYIYGSQDNIHIIDLRKTSPTKPLVQICEPLLRFE